MDLVSFSSLEVLKCCDRSGKIGKKIDFLRLFLEPPKNFEGHIYKKIYQNQLEHQKIYNLVTNFFQNCGDI